MEWTEIKEQIDKAEGIEWIERKGIEWIQIQWNRMDIDTMEQNGQNKRNRMEIEIKEQKGYNRKIGNRTKN